MAPKLPNLNKGTADLSFEQSPAPATPDDTRKSCKANGTKVDDGAQDNMKYNNKQRNADEKAGAHDDFDNAIEPRPRSTLTPRPERGSVRIARTPTSITKKKSAKPARKGFFRQIAKFFESAPAEQHEPEPEPNADAKDASVVTAVETADEIQPKPRIPPKPKKQEPAQAPDVFKTHETLTEGAKEPTLREIFRKHNEWPAHLPLPKSLEHDPDYRNRAAEKKRLEVRAAPEPATDPEPALAPAPSSTPSRPRPRSNRFSFDSVHWKKPEMSKVENRDCPFFYDPYNNPYQGPPGSETFTMGPCSLLAHGYPSPLKRDAPDNSYISPASNRLLGPVKPPSMWSSARRQREGLPPRMFANGSRLSQANGRSRNRMSLSTNINGTPANNTINNNNNNNNNGIRSILRNPRPASMHYVPDFSTHAEAPQNENQNTNPNFRNSLSIDEVLYNDRAMKERERQKAEDEAKAERKRRLSNRASFSIPDHQRLVPRKPLPDPSVDVRNSCAVGDVRKFVNSLGNPRARPHSVARFTGFDPPHSHSPAPRQNQVLKVLDNIKKTEEVERANEIAQNKRKGIPIVPPGASKRRRKEMGLFVPPELPGWGAPLPQPRLVKTVRVYDEDYLIKRRKEIEEAELEERKRQYAEAGITMRSIKIGKRRPRKKQADAKSTLERAVKKGVDSGNIDLTGEDDDQVGGKNDDQEKANDSTTKEAKLSGGLSFPTNQISKPAKAVGVTSLPALGSFPQSSLTPFSSNQTEKPNAEPAKKSSQPSASKLANAQRGISAPVADDESDLNPSSSQKVETSNRKEHVGTDDDKSVETVGEKEKQVKEADALKKEVEKWKQIALEAQKSLQKFATEPKTDAENFNAQPELESKKTKDASDNLFKIIDTNKSKKDEVETTPESNKSNDIEPAKASGKENESHIDKTNADASTKIVSEEKTAAEPSKPTGFMFAKTPTTTLFGGAPSFGSEASKKPDEPTNPFKAPSLKTPEAPPPFQFSSGPFGATTQSKPAEAENDEKKVPNPFATAFAGSKPLSGEKPSFGTSGDDAAVKPAFPNLFGAAAAAAAAPSKDLSAQAPPSKDNDNKEEKPQPAPILPAKITTEQENDETKDSSTPNPFSSTAPVAAPALFSAPAKPLTTGFPSFTTPAPDSNPFGKADPKPTESEEVAIVTSEGSKPTSKGLGPFDVAPVSNVGGKVAEVENEKKDTDPGTSANQTESKGEDATKPHPFPFGAPFSTTTPAPIPTFGSLGGSNLKEDEEADNGDADDDEVRKIGSGDSDPMTAATPPPDKSEAENDDDDDDKDASAKSQPFSFGSGSSMPTFGMTSSGPIFGGSAPVAKAEGGPFADSKFSASQPAPANFSSFVFGAGSNPTAPSTTTAPAAPTGFTFGSANNTNSNTNSGDNNNKDNSLGTAPTGFNSGTTFGAAPAANKPMNPFGAPPASITPPTFGANPSPSPPAFGSQPFNPAQPFGSGATGFGTGPAAPPFGSANTTNDTNTNTTNNANTNPSAGGAFGMSSPPINPFGTSTATPNDANAPATNAFAFNSTPAQTPAANAFSMGSSAAAPRRRVRVRRTLNPR